ncbi:MAG: endolytic transglycosylase MltG [Candidatus Thiodiazotropha sp.]
MNRLIGTTVFVVSILLAWGWMEYDGFIGTPLTLPDEGVDYVLAPGTSVRALAEDLSQKGILQKPILFEILVRWSGQASGLKAGEYHVPKGTTPPELMQIFTSTKVVQHALTLIEGWTFKQMMQSIRENPVLQHTLNEGDPASIMQQLGLQETHPEGLFYPDTYHFPKGTSDRDYLLRAYQRMQEVLQRAWAGREEGLPLETPYEALILASIVERETGLPEERGKIAGVFVRRLQKGMLLQTDPTVIYGMGDAYNGNIRKRDLRQDTPYNTYVRKGLPPTPIAMPSGAAIQAVMHPEKGNALFFVATGDGGHVFSDTLDAHNKAVRKYQLKQ